MSDALDAILYSSDLVKKLTAERDQLRAERDELEQARDEYKEQRDCAARERDAAVRERDEARDALADLRAEVRADFAPRRRAIAEALTEEVSRCTAEQIAAHLLSSEIANVAGVDLTNPTCPIGVTLTEAAEQIRAGAWRKEQP